MLRRPHIILSLFLSCNALEKTGDATVIGPGDEVLIEFSLFNAYNVRFDGSDQPGGILPLRVVAGRGYLLPSLDSLLIGKSVGDTIRAYLPPERALGKQGAWYHSHFGDTMYIVHPADTIRAEVIIVKVNSSGHR